MLAPLAVQDTGLGLGFNIRVLGKTILTLFKPRINKAL